MIMGINQGSGRRMMRNIIRGSGFTVHSSRLEIANSRLQIKRIKAKMLEFGAKVKGVFRNELGF